MYNSVAFQVFTKLYHYHPRWKPGPHLEVTPCCLATVWLLATSNLPFCLSRYPRFGRVICAPDLQGLL